MGRKGISKRKSAKVKAPVVSGASAKKSVPAPARVSDSPSPQTLGKGEAISSSKGGKKSSEAARNKKR